MNNNDYTKLKEETSNDKNSKPKLIYFIILIIILIIIKISIFKFKKEPLISKYKKNPFLQTEFLLNTFNKSKKLDLTLFKKNKNTLKQKIKYLISNKEKNKDTYKCLSTIYGAFLADSMGSNCEFSEPNKSNHLTIYSNILNRRFEPGQITDDSELAMSISFSILDNLNYEKINPNILFFYYSIWYNSNPKDIGITTGNALSKLNIYKTSITDKEIFSAKFKKEIKEENNLSLSNGFCMRLSPFLSWFYMMNKDYISNILKSKLSEKYYELYIKIYNEISKDNQLSHPNEEQPIAGSILIFMGLCSMQDNISGKEILEKIQILFSSQFFNNENNKNEIKINKHFKNLLSIYRNQKFNKDIFFSNIIENMGNLYHAFNLTIYYLETFDENKKKMSLTELYTKIIYEINDFGGDTDTNGAIVGMIIGPLIGVENFEKKYFDVFLDYFSEERIIYTNVLMYFYVEFLKDISSKYIIKNLNGVSFKFMDIMLKMLYTEIE